jgi:hypothetical protein
MNLFRTSLQSRHRCSPSIRTHGFQCPHRLFRGVAVGVVPILPVSPVALGIVVVVGASTEGVDVGTDTLGSFVLGGTLARVDGRGLTGGFAVDSRGQW